MLHYFDRILFKTLTTTQSLQTEKSSPPFLHNEFRTVISATPIVVYSYTSTSTTKLDHFVQTHIENLYLNDSSHEITLNGEVIDLTMNREELDDNFTEEIDLSHNQTIAELITNQIMNPVINSTGREGFTMENLTDAFVNGSLINGTGNTFGNRYGMPFPAIPVDYAQIERLENISKDLLLVVPYSNILGIVGNVVAILAFMFSPLRLNALSHFLVALCVSDLLQLVCYAILEGMKTHGINVLDEVGGCQIISFVILIAR